jgi:hypothetical protein
MDNLNALYDLYKTLKAARTKRGVMDFARIETQVLFESKLPSASIFISQVIHRRSTSGLIEHKPFESSSGNIGTTRRGK